MGWEVSPGDSGMLSEILLFYVCVIFYLQLVFNSIFKMKSSGQGVLRALNCPMSFGVIVSEMEMH